MVCLCVLVGGGVGGVGGGGGGSAKKKDTIITKIEVRERSNISLLYFGGWLPPPYLRIFSLFLNMFV